MEKHFVTVEEAGLKSKVIRKMNSVAKEKAKRKARLSTEEGKANALAFIFGTKGE